MRMFPGFEQALHMPWTYNYVVRKRQQVDSLNEIPKEKRPPEKMIWWGAPEEIDEWIDKVYLQKDKKKETNEFTIVIKEDEIG